jgi:hypothetical protein
MGEDIEIRDVNGNIVRVPLYPTIAACGRRVQGHTSVPCGDGTQVVIFRENLPLPETACPSCEHPRHAGECTYVSEPKVGA